MSERSWLRRRGGSRAELSRAGQLLRAAPQQRAAVRSLARSAPGAPNWRGYAAGARTDWSRNSAAEQCGTTASKGFMVCRFVLSCQLCNSTVQKEETRRHT